MRFTPSEDVRTVRSRLDHPVVDGDGHLVEVVPLVVDRVRELAGPSTADGFTRYLGTMFTSGTAATPVRVPFRGSPAGTLDRLTPALPALMHARLEEIGVDFAVLYPGIGLPLMSCADEELRTVGARAMNDYYAEVFADFRDRLEPTAIVPTFTPAEAVAELDHAVGELGLKAVVMSGVVPRPSRADGAGPWVDTLAHDSDLDYDPVWARCEELGVVPAFHGIGFGWGSRTSRTSYLHNHLGSFAAAQEAICRSLVTGGVAKRFPRLRFAFLEGGVTWACQLLVDLLGHWDKRNVGALARNDPAAIDLAFAEQLVDEFGRGPLADRRASVREAIRRSAAGAGEPDDLDEWAPSGITGPDDLVEVFARQLFFGCEADDPLVALAFTPALLPEGARVNAFFGSDVGHWDVPDMRDVLPEAWEPVATGRITPGDFRDFAFANVARMLTDVNPAFFAGTAVGDAVAPLLDAVG